MKTTHLTKNALLLGISILPLLASNVQAGERESLEQLKATTTSLVDLLVQEGVLSKDKADAMLKKAAEEGARKAQEVAKQAKAEAAGEAPPEDSTVRVQYVPEHVKKKLREEIKQEVMAQAKEEKWAAPNVIPEWTDRITFNGDLRLRYENNSYPEVSGTLSDGTTINKHIPSVKYKTDARFEDIKNTSEDTNKAKLRARLGVDVKVNDWLTGGLRMTTGSLTSPVSPNQTQDTNGKYTIGLDRVYLKAQPTSWLMVEGGRFSNPWMHTDLVWDPDLAFDGIAATASHQLNEKWSGFVTAGAFPIDQTEKTDTNLAEAKWMYGAQGGIKWNFAEKSSAKIGLAYYDFSNVEGIANPVGSNAYAATIPAFRQKGNNTFNIDQVAGSLACSTSSDAACHYGLASKFQLINLTGQVDLATFDPIHVTLTGDYVKNIGFDKAEILKRTGNSYSKENEGYQVRLDVGMPSFGSSAINQIKRNDWQVSMGYKRLEADAVLDGFTDSDFHLGGTDAEGWLLAANYGIDKNTWLSARYFSSDTISGLPLPIDVLLIDLNAKF